MLTRIGISRLITFFIKPLFVITAFVLLPSCSYTSSTENEKIGAILFNVYSSRITESDRVQRNKYCPPFFAEDQKIYHLVLIATPYARGYSELLRDIRQESNAANISFISTENKGLKYYIFQCDNNGLMSSSGKYIFYNNPSETTWDSVPLLPAVSAKRVTCSTVNTPEEADYKAKCVLILEDGSTVETMRIAKSLGLIAEVVVSGNRNSLSIHEVCFVPQFLYKRYELNIP